jgi:aconitate hydratase
MDRHVIANMGAELGATTSVFPSDEQVRRFLELQGRGADYVTIIADKGEHYDEHEEINLSELEPLIALPSSPGNVVPVREVAGREIYQAVIGSSANPGLRDFGIAALIVQGKLIHPRVSLDINPTSRQILENLVKMGHMSSLLRSGARIHQSGCNGCIGMGQAPASGRISLRTVPRNFPGRSGTEDDEVYLCSPETAAASALTGQITDPRSLDMPYPQFRERFRLIIMEDMLEAPPESGADVELVKGPNIKPLPAFDPLPQTIEAPVLLKVGDDISTDEILPAGARILPFRSNIPEISKFTFSQLDPDYYQRALEHQADGSIIVGGSNYGQGSSREHAALAPRFLGVRVVIAKSFARIHWQNLVNFGILPLTFDDSVDYDRLENGDVLVFANLPQVLRTGTRVYVWNKTKNEHYDLSHKLTDRQVGMVLAGSLINVIRTQSQQAG